MAVVPPYHLVRDIPNAAKRIRRLQAGESAVSVYSPQTPGLTLSVNEAFNEKMKDAALLAYAYSQEHQDGDDEPIDNNWVKFNFTIDRLGRGAVLVDSSPQVTLLCNARTKQWGVFAHKKETGDEEPIEPFLLFSVKTRGQVRRLQTLIREGAGG